MNQIDCFGNPSDFHHITARLKIPLAPIFLSKPSRNPQINSTDNKDLIQSPSNQISSDGPIEAVNQSIASLLMKYIPSLGSVLVSYLQPPVFILHDEEGRPFRRVANKSHKLPIPTLPGNGWGVIDVEVNLMGWRPTIGQKIIGRPTLSSPSHLSLVIYQTFNATINENHLKSAGYYYDLNAQIPSSWTQLENGDAENHTRSRTHLTADEHRECGSWVDSNGKVVGGEDGFVSFTVISLTIANHMISVVGSLLDDPFSVESVMQSNHLISKGTPSKLRGKSLDKSNFSDEEEGEEDQAGVRLGSQPKPRISNQLKSPPPIKSSRPKARQSKRLSETKHVPQQDDLVPVDVDENVIPKSKKSIKTTNSPTKSNKKLKRSVSRCNDTSPTTCIVSSSPLKRSQSTPSKKKIKIQ